MMDSARETQVRGRVAQRRFPIWGASSAVGHPVTRVVMKDSFLKHEEGYAKPASLLKCWLKGADFLELLNFEYFVRKQPDLASRQPCCFVVMMYKQGFDVWHTPTTRSGPMPASASLSPMICSLSQELWTGFIHRRDRLSVARTSSCPHLIRCMCVDFGK